MTPEAVAKRIGMPVSRWPGRCHEVAALCLVAGVTSGTLRYGLWHGPVKGKRDGHPVHHGWVEVDPSADDAWDIHVCAICQHVQDEHACNGLLNACEISGCGCGDFVRHRGGARIFDPTRFVFEERPPYLFDDEDDMGYYDVAGSREQARRLQPITPEELKGSRKTVTLELDGSTTVMVLRLLAATPARSRVKSIGGKLRVPFRAATWLATQPVHELGPFAEPIYKALEAAGLKAAIPVDFREFIFGDGFYGKRAEIEAMVAKAARKPDRKAAAS